MLGCEPRQILATNVHRLTAPVVLTEAVVSACSTINPQIGRIETFKQSAAAKTGGAMADVNVVRSP